MKLLKKFLLLCSLILVIMLYVGCSSDSSSSSDNFILYPIYEPQFEMYPNDAAQNDSAAANLAKGVYLDVTPGGMFKLSFEVESSKDVPELQLFRVTKRDGKVYPRMVRQLEAKKDGNRLVYEFDCKEPFKTTWVTTLRTGERFYTGKIRNVKYEGEGPFAQSISLNFVVAGEYSGTADSLSVEELAQKFKTSLEASYRFKIDSLYISYADMHPIVGKKYPRNRPFVVPYSAAQTEEEMYALGYPDLAVWENSKKSKALDIVLVHRIASEQVLGYSYVFGGSVADSGSAVVVATRYTIAGHVSEPLLSDEIVQVAIHETGHFLGLRHTTSTESDVQGDNDYSNVEDGLDDTGWCPAIALKKQGNENFESTRRIRRRANDRRSFYRVNVDCPDSDNMMFPYSTGNIHSPLTSGQLEIVRKSLSLIVH